MVRKFTCLAVLVTSLAVPTNVHAANVSSQQQQVMIQNYSISDVANLLGKRGKSLYFASKGEIVRVGYVPISRSILIEIIKESTAGEELRELSAEDPLMAKLTGNFTSDLYFISKGEQYGNNPKDDYSPLNEPIQSGFKIGLEGVDKFSHYLQLIGDLLNK